MVDNSNISFEYFLSYGNMSSVLPNTLTVSYMLQRRKSSEIIEHQSIKQVLRIRLPKVYRPNRHGFLREAYDFWITKGPQERLRSYFNT